MASTFQFNKLVPYISAIVLFLIIAFAYFPEVLDGKQLGGHDNANFRGMAREAVDYREETGKEALWTNSMFSGMPTFMISARYNGNLLVYLDRVLQAGPRPVSFVFLYLIGFYILLLALRVNPWLAIAGAIAFAFSSYNFVIVVAGHNSKAIAIGYMAPVIAGMPAVHIEEAIYAYRDGARQCRYEPLMCETVLHTSDDRIADLAEHYANQVRVSSKEPHDKDLAAKGAQLHKKLCGQCHVPPDNPAAADMLGIPLHGQRAVYLRYALQSYRDGRRENLLDTMGERLAQLDDDDVEALVNYYASY